MIKYCIILILISSSTILCAQQSKLIIKNSILNKIANGEFNDSSSPFNFSLMQQIQGEKYTELIVSKSEINKIINEKNETLKLRIPFGENNFKMLLLQKTKLFSNNSKIIIQGTTKQEIQIPNFVSYQGIVSDESEKTLVSILVTSNAIRGIISIGEKEYTLTPYDDNGENNNYKLYEKSEVKLPTQNASCGVSDDFNNIDLNSTQNSPNVVVAKCVSVHFEISYLKVNQWGGTTTAIDKFLNIFNSVQTIYANDNITIKTSYLKLWAVQDPYIEDNRITGIIAFNNNSGPLFGDIGHLLNGLYQGGIAYLGNGTDCRRICNSGVDNSNGNFPNYSWNVNIISHEMGHTLGSNHTQWCGWTGGALDNCVATEGGCPPGPAPTGGGTIMSYCHLTGYGINFNNGFGVEPGNTIRNIVNNSSCFSSCDNAPLCTDSLVRGVVINDNGDKLVIKWISLYPIKLYKRTDFSQPAIFLGTFLPPLDSIVVQYTNDCLVEKAEFTLIGICPLGEGKPTLLITEPKGKRPLLNYRDSLKFCTVDSLLLSINTNIPAYSYQWKLNNVNISGANAPTYKAYLPGYYQCQQTMPNGCSFKTDSLNLIGNQTIANYSYTKSGLTVNFSNSSTCSNAINWQFGNGNSSSTNNPTETFARHGIYDICLSSSNIVGSSNKCLSIPVFNEWFDNMNDTTDGIPNAITYQNSQCDRASEFKRNSTTNAALNSFITFPQNNWIPDQGTLEFSIKVLNGQASNGISTTSATIFSVGNHVLYRSFIVAYSNGNIFFRRYNGLTYTDITANATPFRFNEWHIISVSYGSFGTQIAVDGIIFLTNNSVNFKLNQGLTTLGQVAFQNSTAWSGFEGLVDKFRISYSQSDFLLNNNCSTYTFIGNGNWSNALNWKNNLLPPIPLPNGSQIIIDGQLSGESILNYQQTLSPGSKLIIKPDKKLILPNELILQ